VDGGPARTAKDALRAWIGKTDSFVQAAGFGPPRFFPWMVFCDFPKTGFCWILEEGCARPERTTFRKKIQDWQQGRVALCRGVSDGSGHHPPFPDKLLASRGGWPR
jgi:hypothetical protein